MGIMQRGVNLVMCLILATIFAGCASSPQQRSTGEYVDDKAISTKVKSAIVAEPDLKASQINVETYNGVVQLSGFVDSETNTKRAGEVASSVPGVKSVINNLVIRPVQGR